MSSEELKELVLTVWVPEIEAATGSNELYCLDYHPTSIFYWDADSDTFNRVTDMDIHEIAVRVSCEPWFVRQALVDHFCEPLYLKFPHPSVVRVDRFRLVGDLA